MFLTAAPAALGSDVERAPAPKHSLAQSAAILAAFLAPFLFYVETLRAIVSIWNSSETFAHGYVILPISLWLVWRRRGNFVSMPPRPYWPALGLVLVLGLAWLVARMGGVQVVMQYAFVALIPAIALAVLGRRLAWSLAFPLLFLLMAVPFGEIFIDPLISFTADFTVWALQATGIPVLRNGTRFEIPSGSWSVVEACSGIRYLVSSITLGLLYAYLTYRSFFRRALFMLIAVLVPIVANGLRAYMIVMIGHLSGMRLAVGVDHLIYGWVFFGLVMFVMFWIGSYWREDLTPVETPASERAVSMPASTARMLATVMIVILTAGIWPLLARYNDRATFNPKSVVLRPIASNWITAAPFTRWTPDFAPADATLSMALRDPAGITDPVGLSLLYYRNQHSGRTLISSTNRLAKYESAYQMLHATVRTETLGTRTLALREATLQDGTGTMLVWYCYWINGRFTASSYVGKLLQAKSKLLFHNDDGAAMLVFAPYSADAGVARTVMHTFLNANLPAIESTLAAAGEN